MKGLIFTYLMTYGGAVVSLINPFVGLLIYISFAILKPESLWYWAVPPGSYSRILAIAFLIGWALHGFGNWNFGRAKPILIAMLGYWGWMILCAAMAPNQKVAWSFVESQSKILLPVFVGMTLIDSTKKLKQVAWVIMLSQAYVAWELNLSYLQGFNRVKMAGFGGMDNNCVSIAMVTGAGLAFFLGLGETVWWRRWGAFAAAALMAHVPMMAMSRGGMLGLCVVGMMAFILIPKQPKHYALFALAIAVALIMAGPSVRERFGMTFADKEERDASAQNRLDFWGYCWTFMRENPVTGIGPNHYPAMARTRFDRGGEAHSLWFQTGAEMGFMGVGFLAAYYLMTVGLLWRRRREDRWNDPWNANAARMVIAALTGFCVSVSFVSLEGLEIPYYIVLIGAGALKLQSLNEEVHDVEEHEMKMYDESDLAFPYSPTAF
ncbi:MAG: O-antigen ligase family protein [Pirellulales bacterium]|nr:O-antigen ligase family protein [Pirellulales bacterium]